MIGAGPVGLAASAHLTERGMEHVVLESGQEVGATVRAWGHVQLFSPWRFNIDPAARRLLEETEWRAPEEDRMPTGNELVDAYLAPLAAHPAVRPRVRLGAEVSMVARLGMDRVKTSDRENAPFLIRLSSGEELLARAVIDCGGTWRTPNPLGATGLPALGERQALEANLIGNALPDVLGADRALHAGKRTLVVGAGHSAANTLIDLARLAEQAPGTVVKWAIRGRGAERVYGGGSADALPGRGAIGTRLRALVESGRITLLTDFRVHRVVTAADHAVVIGRDLDGNERKVTTDRIVAATGFRPDHSLAAEIRLDVDPVLASARALAPLIDPNEHSCGTVPPHGAAELAHAEKDFYVVGAKSYGRAPTFLLATGYEQARSVVAALDGDWDAALRVQLELPETGVCSTDIDTDSEQGGCCGPAPEAVPAGSALPLAAPADPGSAAGCCGG
ncbi:NAD(P)-binding domain-containing protein [Streptomyces capparidis]